MKRLALLSLCLHVWVSQISCAPRDAAARSDDPGSVLRADASASESKAVFGNYDVFGSISRTEHASPRRFHKGLFDFEFVFERGGNGALGNKSQSHVLSASLIKNTLGEAHGVMNATVFAPGVGDVIGQFMNVYGGGTWLPSDEGIVAYRTFIGDVGRIPVASATYRAGDEFLSPRDLGHDGWRRIGEGNLVVFADRTIAVAITGYRRGTWSYSSPVDRDWTGMCFAHEETAYPVQDEEGKRITVYQWLAIDDDGVGNFSTEQIGSNTGRDVHVPLDYPIGAGRGRIAPCERVAYVDRSENRIGIVAAVNPDWAAGSDEWNDPGRHPSRNSCSGNCTFHVVPLPNAQMVAYKAIASHKLGSSNPESIQGFSAVCANSNYDCDSAFDVRSLGKNLDGTATNWEYGLYGRPGSVDVLAALQTRAGSGEALGEVDVHGHLGTKGEAEVVRVRRNRQRQPQLALSVDLGRESWKIGERPIVVGGTLRDGGVCTWDRAAGEIDCSTPISAWNASSRPVAGSVDRAPVLYASTDANLYSQSRTRVDGRAANETTTAPECHRETLFSPSDADDHFFMKLPYELAVTRIECIAEGGGEIALTLQQCDGSASGCEDSAEPVSCDGDGAASADLFGGAVFDSEAWVRVQLDAPTGGPVRTLTYTICGTRRIE